MKNYQSLFYKYAKVSPNKSTKDVKAFQLDNLTVCFFSDNDGYFLIKEGSRDFFEINSGGTLEDLMKVEIIRITLDKLHLEEQLQFNSGKKKIQKI